MTPPRTQLQPAAGRFARARSLVAVVGRRLLVQAALSGTVMLGLQTVSQIDLGLAARLAGVEWSRLADADAAPERAEEEDTTARLNVEPLRRPDLVRTASLTPAPPTAGSIGPAVPVERTGRLPVPARIDATERQAAVQPRARPRTAGQTRAQGLHTASAADVVRFDECRPACESRDPLLLPTAMAIGGRDGATVTPAVQRIVSVDPSEAVAALGSRRSEAALPPARGVVDTAMDGLVGAREAAASAAGRVAGLVGW